MATTESVAKKIQRLMGSSVPSWIPRGKWNGKTYNHIFIDVSSNFIDGCFPEYCNLKGNLSDAQIKYHQGASHMNSSQVMCISFFKKFFEKPEYEMYLLKALINAGIGIGSDEAIESAAFEYEPNAVEGTNFDFYMILTSGKRLSFEIKYTEAEFGSISSDKNDPQKYDRKWNVIYKKMVEDSCLLDVEKDDFYDNYQINRNIVYALKGDYVLFLTPKANDEKRLIKGRAYIDAMDNEHIKNLYWEDMAGKTLEAVKDCEELKDYFSKFYDKYIEILNLR